MVRNAEPALDSEDTASSETTRPRDSCLVRIGLGLLLLIAPTIALGDRPESTDPKVWSAIAVGSWGATFALIGLLVPWWRFAAFEQQFVPPGANLAFTSRFLGWLGVGLLPALAVAGLWPLVAIAAVLPISTLGLWKRQGWAVWPWYLVALGFLGLGAYAFFGMIAAQFGGDDVADVASGSYLRGVSAGKVFATVFYGSLGLFLANETRDFQMQLASETPRRER